jgi:hypothetical protein
MHDLRNKLPSLVPAQFIDSMVKAIKYRDYLVKEEWGESQADEKYENIWQIINMAEKYQQTGDEGIETIYGRSCFVVWYCWKFTRSFGCCKIDDCSFK